MSSFLADTSAAARIASRRPTASAPCAVSPSRRRTGSSPERVSSRKPQAVAAPEVAAPEVAAPEVAAAAVAAPGVEEAGTCTARSVCMRGQGRRAGCLPAAVTGCCCCTGGCCGRMLRAEGPGCRGAACRGQAAGARLQGRCEGPGSRLRARGEMHALPVRSAAHMRWPRGHTPRGHQHARQVHARQVHARQVHARPATGVHMPARHMPGVHAGSFGRKRGPERLWATAAGCSQCQAMVSDARDACVIESTALCTPVCSTDK